MRYETQLIFASFRNDIISVTPSKSILDRLNEEESRLDQEMESDKFEKVNENGCEFPIISSDGNSMNSLQKKWAKMKYLSLNHRC